MAAVVYQSTGGHPLYVAKMQPNLPTHDWEVVKVEPHEGPISQVIVVLNKESVSPIEAAHGELNFGFSAIRIKVYKGDSNSKEDPTGNPAEQVFPEEIEAPGDDEPEDGYSTDASLSRGMQAMNPADEDDGDLSGSVEADVTVVEGNSANVAKTTASEPPSQ